MSISAQDVKRLRDMTGAPMMDCKSALQKAEGDMDKAVQVLRESNAAIQAKKGARETAEGRVGVYFDSEKAVAGIVELRCESAPVAKSDQFVELAGQLAKHVALTEPAAKDAEALLTQPFVENKSLTVKDRIGEVVGVMRENMKPARLTRLSGGVFGNYVHFDGTVGVLIQADGAPSEAATAVLKDICMHITARQPLAARREDMDPAEVAKEKEIATSQAAATGKPANIVEKIAEGKMKTWYAENVLVEQPFVKDDSKTIGDLLKSAGLEVKRFVRYKVGELAP